MSTKMEFYKIMLTLTLYKKISLLICIYLIYFRNSNNWQILKVILHDSVIFSFTLVIFAASLIILI